MFFNDSESFRKIFLEGQLYSELHQLSAQEIKRCSYDYRKGNLTIVLGSGVSLSFGLPDWRTLLSGVLDEALKENKHHEIIKQSIELVSSNNLITANHIRNLCKSSNDLEFYDMLKRNLYKNYDKTKAQDLFLEIANLIPEVNTFNEYNTKHSINSIITYNYDDIFQQTVKTLNTKLKLKTIYKAGQICPKNALPIFHVHGYLPLDNAIFGMNDIVLLESSYHEQYADTFKWNNIVQYNAFLNQNCIFIGVSLEDPNLRRLLYMAAKNNPSKDNFHYLIKRKYNQNDVLATLSKEGKRDYKNKSETEKEEIIQSLHSIAEEDANKLKISIIWINDYFEIPRVINDIFCFSLTTKTKDFIFFRSNDDPAEFFKSNFENEYRQIALTSKNKLEFENKLIQAGDKMPKYMIDQFIKYYDLDE